MEETEMYRENPPRGARRWGRIAWLTIEFVFNKIADALSEYFDIIKRESELFLGIALVLVGFLNFQNGKNCDGNTADYLTCTRPSTFYYYSWIEITVIIIGVFLVLLWLLKLQHRRAHH
jgi:hypothetical protein